MSARDPTNAAGSVPRAGAWGAVVAALFAAVVIAYWPSLHVPLLLDDFDAIRSNASLRSLSPLSTVLSPAAPSPTAGRPLLNLTFALNYAWAGDAPESYHVVNLLVHLGAGLTLFGLLRRTVPRSGRIAASPGSAWGFPAFATVIWLLHPLQTEAVTYLSQRAESLMGWCYLLVLYCLCRSVRAPRPGLWLTMSVLACAAGMATKEVMVTAPILALLYDRVFLSGSFREAWRQRRAYYGALALTWAWLAFLLYRSPLAVKGVGFDQGVSVATYAITEARVVLRYVQLCFWPQPLVFDYGAEIMASVNLASVAWLLVPLAYAGAVAATWRRSPAAGFVLVAFGLILAPTSSVVPIANQPMAESRLYLSLAAVSVGLAWGAYRVGPRFAVIALTFVGVTFGGMTAARNADYRSELVLWEDTVAKQPYSVRAHGVLCQLLRHEPGRLDEAIAHGEAAVRLGPGSAKAHLDLANALALSPARRLEALEQYATAVRLRPADAEAQYDFATLLAQVGRTVEAVTHFEAGLQLNPRDAAAHHNLANTLSRLPGRRDDALAHFRAATALQPSDALYHFSLGATLAGDATRREEAVAELQRALQLRPGYAPAHLALGNVLAGMPARRAEAVGHYAAALQAQPDLMEAHANLGITLAAMPGRLHEAIGHLQEAVRLRPDFAPAHNNLGTALQAARRTQEARTEFEAAVRLDPNFVEAQHNLALSRVQGE